MLAASLTAQNAASHPRLCRSRAELVFRSDDADCRSLPDTTVEDAPLHRLFALISEDGRRFAFGRTAEALTHLVTGAPGELHRLAIQIGSSSSSWPVATKLRITVIGGRGEQWFCTLSRASVTQLREVFLPSGSYQLELTAPHHEPFAVSVDATRPSDLGRVRLHPLPVLSGKVVARSTGVPIFGATITADAAMIENTDSHGEFRHELAPKESPGALTIAAPGFGTRVVMLPQTRSDQALPVIELEGGGSVRLRLEPDRVKSPSGSIELIRIEGRRRSVAARGEIDSRHVEWEKRDVDPGNYVLLLSGPKPLQRIGRTVTVKAGETSEVGIRIDPIDFTVTVTRGGAPLESGEVTLQSVDFGWEGSLKTDNLGSASTELWQPGKFGALISSSLLREPYLHMDDISAESHVEWHIDIPSGVVTGRVLDGQTGAPLKAADLTLDSASSDNVQRSVGAQSDEAGRFVFEGVTPGVQTLIASKQHYAKSAPRTFVLANPSETKEVDIPLDPVRRYPFLVVGADGSPLVGAYIARAGVPAGATPTTDGAGRVDVDVDGSAGALFAILPVSGSFALHRVPPSSVVPEEATRIVVGGGGASLIVKTFTEDSDPTPVRNVRVLLRYEHEYLDPELLQVIGQLRGIVFTTDTRGQLSLFGLPPGTYELWPYGSQAEALAIMHSGRRPSAVVPVAAGIYEVTMRIAATP